MRLLDFEKNDMHTYSTYSSTSLPLTHLANYKKLFSEILSRLHGNTDRYYITEVWPSVKKNQSTTSLFSF